MHTKVNWRVNGSASNTTYYAITFGAFTHKVFIQNANAQLLPFTLFWIGWRVFHQVFPNVTVDSSANDIPAETQIVVSTATERARVQMMRN